MTYRDSDFTGTAVRNIRDMQQIVSDINRTADKIDRHSQWQGLVSLLMICVTVVAVVALIAL